MMTMMMLLRGVGVWDLNAADVILEKIFKIQAMAEQGHTRSLSSK